MIVTLLSGNNNDDVDPNDNESESCLQAMTMMMKIVTHRMTLRLVSRNYDDNDEKYNCQW